MTLDFSEVLLLIRIQKPYHDATTSLHNQKFAMFKLQSIINYELRETETTNRAVASLLNWWVWLK